MYALLHTLSGCQMNQRGQGNPRRVPNLLYCSKPPACGGGSAPRARLRLRAARFARRRLRCSLASLRSATRLGGDRLPFLKPPNARYMRAGWRYVASGGDSGSIRCECPPRQVMEPNAEQSRPLRFQRGAVSAVSRDRYGLGSLSIDPQHYYRIPD